MKNKKVFIRKETWKLSRFGKTRKKKRVWRRPRGMHSKLRLKLRGKMSQPSIGYGSPLNIRGKIEGLIPKIVRNEQDLENINKNNEIAIIGKVGLKNKIGLVEKAVKSGIKIANVNAEEFLKNFKLKGKKTAENKK